MTQWLRRVASTLLRGEGGLVYTVLGMNASAKSMAFRALGSVAPVPCRAASSSGSLTTRKRHLPDISDDVPVRKQPKTRDSHGCEVDEQGFVIVYTDGASSNNGYAGARAGWGVYWGEGHPFNENGRVHGAQTNNRGELLGVLKAIEKAKANNYEKVRICTDSQLLINTFTAFIHKWKRNGWKTASGSDVLNVDLIKDIDAAKRGITVRFEKVRAHSGIPGNEGADALAVQGAQKPS